MSNNELPTDKWGWPIFSEKLESVFVEMITDQIFDLTNGNMHKGRFIGMYVDRLRELDPDHSDRYKYPHFVSKESSDRKNNWLDFILDMDEELITEFERGLKEYG